MFKKNTTLRDKDGSVHSITGAQVKRLKMMKDIGDITETEYNKKIALLPKRKKVLGLF